VKWAIFLFVPQFNFSERTSQHFLGGPGLVSLNVSA